MVPLNVKQLLRKDHGTILRNFSIVCDYNSKATIDNLKK